MKIETRYSLGDLVFNIHRVHQKEWIPCGFCEGTGDITGADGKERYCPECHGNKGAYKLLKKAWAIEDNIVVRLIEYRYTKSEIKETYMAGTGGGRVYGIENLYPTKEEAQAECDRRNSLLEEKSNE